VEPDGPPLDALSASELVARVIAAIDRGSEADLDVLLSDLLVAAWGNLPAQNQ
jgi:hypothetical protein